MRLTSRVGGSLPSLKKGVKNLLVISEIDKISLVTIQDSKSARCPLNLELNLFMREAPSGIW